MIADLPSSWRFYVIILLNWTLPLDGSLAAATSVARAVEFRKFMVQVIPPA
jgi:hypothetical protein